MKHESADGAGRQGVSSPGAAGYAAPMSQALRERIARALREIREAQEEREQYVERRGRELQREGYRRVNRFTYEKAGHIIVM